MHDRESNNKNPSDRNSTSVAGPTSASHQLSADVLESLYRSYSLKQKRSGLTSFIYGSIIFDLWALLIQDGNVKSLGVTCLFLALNISLVTFLKFCGKSRFRGAVWKVSPLLAWIFAIAQLVLQIAVKSIVTPRDFLGWAILLNFLVYVTIPVALQNTGIILSFGSVVIYVVAIAGLAREEKFFWEQQVANFLLILTAALIGFLCYILGEGQQRRAFVEAKQSLEVKTLIEEQSQEQERLLLSVLPEHVAVKMRQDLGSNDSEQFKKIYMCRHENVSILFADIVGFTAISSTYSAQDLVKILNELFARFDRLAEKYQQLRIKILGDCYYCISGIEGRDDHAQLCVFMGLSMVKAIEYVQQKTNSPVDMRVGIHTGAILAGILGQRQWQYDIYSKDVELANKMESSGKAGRVHISEKTLSYLHGEFEVEPAFGEKREEALRSAGLKTYFIGKTLKPFVASDHKINNGVNGGEHKDVVIEPDGPSVVSKDEDESKCTSPTECQDEESKFSLEDEESMENYKIRLRKELVSRDGHHEIDKDTTIFLTFKDSNLERAYSAYREPFSAVPLTASLLVQIIGITYSLFVLPRTLLHFALVLPPTFVIALIVLISIAESFPNNVPAFLVKASKRFNDCVWLRKTSATLIILLLGVSNANDMFASSMTTTTASSYGSGDNQTMHDISQQREDATINYEQLPSVDCILPSYFNHFAVLILIATTIITQLSHLTKIIIMTVFTFTYCLIDGFLFDTPFRHEVNESWNPNVPLKCIVSGMLIAITIALSILSRYMDKMDRVIFKWKTEVTDQEEKATDMRQRNEALVYNILPKHVAEHFMGNRKRSHDELYSQSYSQIGVLFASMPNFSDFYSEESVNNQGLECLRFLNEVISDFDALLELPHFQNHIIKIKTIGSTYMAASGLQPSEISRPNDPVTVKWAHLDLLVEFALKLKEALQAINEQSFNHFVLKMGINHGPITAGVIGARKPHYDIWGNTVNVASRMESTGKAGMIQVTAETCHILEAFGYFFEQRGLVAVKGKGQLMTYYLLGKNDKPPTPPPITAAQPSSAAACEADENPSLAQTAPASQVLPESPNLLTHSSNTTASPSSVRLNQNYQVNNNTDIEADNLDSIGSSNCNENLQNIKQSEFDPLITDSPKSTSTNHSSTNRLRSMDEKDALIDNES